MVEVGMAVDIGEDITLAIITIQDITAVPDADVEDITVLHHEGDRDVIVREHILQVDILQEGIHHHLRLHQVDIHQEVQVLVLATTEVRADHLPDQATTVRLVTVHDQVIMADQVRAADHLPVLVTMDRQVIVRDQATTVETRLRPDHQLVRVIMEEVRPDLAIIVEAPAVAPHPDLAITVVALTIVLRPDQVTIADQVRAADHHTVALVRAAALVADQVPAVVRVALAVDLATAVDRALAAVHVLVLAQATTAVLPVLHGVAHTHQEVVVLLQAEDLHLQVVAEAVVEVEVDNKQHIAI